jgi:hypothetical protein
MIDINVDEMIILKWFIKMHALHWICFGQHCDKLSDLCQQRKGYSCFRKREEFLDRRIARSVSRMTAIRWDRCVLRNFICLAWGTVCTGRHISIRWTDITHFLTT